MTEAQILEFVAMRDCYSMEVQVYDLLPDQPIQLKVHGTWHSDDPLYIKLTNPDGETVIDGYGTDH